MSSIATQPIDPKKIPTDWKPSLPQQPPAPGPWKDQPPKPDPLLETKYQVLALLREQKETVYGLFDAARDDRILELFREYGTPANLPDDRRVLPPKDDPSKCEYESLYILQMKEQLSSVGPWIVRLPKDSVLLEKLVMEGWGKAWGWYITSTSTHYEQRKHFRRFVMVQLPDGEAVLFRIADPRIIAAVFTCVSNYFARTIQLSSIQIFCEDAMSCDNGVLLRKLRGVPA